MTILIIDAAKTSFENDSLITGAWRPGRVQLAGFGVAPNDRGGVTAGLMLRF
jgi:hypothetical protein